MKNFITILFLLISPHIYSQDSIFWSPNYKLSWEDFQRKPDLSSKDDAVSSPGIKYHLSASEDSFSVRVFCFFIRSKSWSKIKSSKNLLMHEQGHFDIAELFARKLRKMFSEYKFKAITVGKDIDYLFIMNKQGRNQFDLDYDKKTNHSQNTNQQILWNKKIRVELDELRKFASS